MKEGKAKRLISSVVLLSVMVFFADLPAFATRSGPIGKVIPKGKGGTIESMGSVKKIKRSEPLFVKSTLTTGEKGGISFVLNDGTRLELGSNSKIYVSGKYEKYFIELKKGELAFNVPRDSTHIIRTSDAEIVVPFEKIAYEPVEPQMEKESFIGLVAYDGKTTKVISERGDIKIKSLESEAEVMKVLSGKGAVITTQLKGERKIMSIRIIKEPMAEKTVKSSSKRNLLYAVGAVVVLGAVAGFAGSGGGGGGGGGPPASPSAP